MKSFEFETGTLSVTKTKHADKPALKLFYDPVCIFIHYDYETARDRAFDNFCNRNALAVYFGIQNMGQTL